MKRVLGVLISLFGIMGIFVSANSGGNTVKYSYFYAPGCAHCIKVENYFATSKLDKKINIQAYDPLSDRESLTILQNLLESLSLSLNEVGTPFLIIESSGAAPSYLMGDTPIIDYFKGIEAELSPSDHDNTGDKDALQGSGTSGLDQEFLVNEQSLPTVEDVLSGQNQNFSGDHLSSGEFISLSGSAENFSGTGVVGITGSGDTLDQEKVNLGFFAIMLPAALADSINPCAFAVMLLLLGTILSKSQSRKRTFLAGLLFCLAIFCSYYLMGVGVLKALATSQNLVILKWIVGILGLLVGLANIKDFFRYGKGFVMEVPLAWRPKMAKLIEGVVSPFGAFVIGLLVSLFLLPCSAGPYITILGYLGSENQTLNLWGHVYLTVYNLIFVLPMVLITILVSFGVASVEKLAKLKHRNTKLIHLIVGLLMLGLGVYVIGSLYRR